MSLEISNLCRHESKWLRCIFWSCIKISQEFVTVLYFNKTVLQSNCILDIIKTYVKSIFTFNFTHVQSKIQVYFRSFFNLNSFRTSLDKASFYIGKCYFTKFGKSKIQIHFRPYFNLNSFRTSLDKLTSTMGSAILQSLGKVQSRSIFDHSLIQTVSGQVWIS